MFQVMDMFEPYRRKRENRKITCQVSHAQDADLPDMANLIVDREGGEHQETIKGLHRYLSGELAHLFVAKVGDEVVGFGKSRKFSGKDVQYEGWYLSGVMVKPEYRGLGIGNALTEKRIMALKAITRKIYYFVNSNNRVSIELHDKFGFRLLVEPFEFPDVVFKSGHGCLYCLSTDDL